MKTNLLAFALLLLGTGICLGAPPEPVEGTHSEVYPTSDSLMKTIREHNRTLQTAWETYQVAMLQAGTGNTPPDPEVEMGYLYGSPTELGNRVDFSVTQEVDFPTAYIYKSRKENPELPGRIRLYHRQTGGIASGQAIVDRAHLPQPEEKPA